MKKTTKVKMKMREIHRYLGFFLVGIFLIYALSGSVMVFRGDNFLKQSKQVEKTLDPNLTNVEVNKIIGIKYLKWDEIRNDSAFFQGGYYVINTGELSYLKTDYTGLLKKMTNLHKAKLGPAIQILNLLFGLSLLFFIVSSFFMFPSKSPIFKKGMRFVFAGLILALVLILMS